MRLPDWCPVGKNPPVVCPGHGCCILAQGLVPDNLFVAVLSVQLVAELAGGNHALVVISYKRALAGLYVAVAVLDLQSAIAGQIVVGILEARNVADAPAVADDGSHVAFPTREGGCVLLG